MSTDFIPTTHDGFFVWQDVFYNRVNEKLNSFKIDAAKLKPLTAAQSKYVLAFHRSENKEASNHADIVERNEREAEYKHEIRTFINAWIRYNPDISDYDKKYLGLVIADRKPTLTPVPVTRPVLKIDFSEPSRHTLHIHDENLKDKKHPAGVKECEIWYKIAAEQPLHYDELHYAGVSTKSTFLVEYDSADEGKKVWYNARWLNTRGEHGPWGKYENAVIA